MKRVDSTLLVLVASLWVAGVGLMWGTRAASGSDSYGYVSQAALWLEGDLVVEQSEADAFPWPDRRHTLVPLGYRLGPTPGTLVPIYPAGLPIVMAVFQAVAGPDGVYWVVPILGMMAVLASAALANRLAGPIAATSAAFLLALSPTVLYGVTWPMSDLAATGWWALAFFCVTGGSLRSAVVGGAAAALAVLTRPNLVAVALVPFAYLAAHAVLGRQPGRFGRLAAFAGLTAIGCLAVAAIHTGLYGSPFESGHGELGTFFETTRRSYNPTGFLLRPQVTAGTFIGFLRSIEPLLVGGAVIGSIVALRPGAAVETRAIAGLCLGVFGVVFASHLFFRTFRDWWVLRLLLPAYPGLAALAGAGVAWIANRIWAPARVIVLAYALLFGSWFGVSRCLEWINESQINESRYADVGRFVAAELPGNAALLAFQHSGSLRFYADRLTVRFDILDEDWLEPAVDALRDHGYVPYFVVEDWETDLFTTRFAESTLLGALDWPPLAEFRGPVGVRIFDPLDRDRHAAGDLLFTRTIEARYPPRRLVGEPEEQ